MLWCNVVSNCFPFVYRMVHVTTDCILVRRSDKIRFPYDETFPRSLGWAFSRRWLTSMVLCHNSVFPLRTVSSRSKFYLIQTQRIRVSVPNIQSLCSTTQASTSRHTTTTTSSTTQTTWVDRLPPKVQPYIYLTRIDKPIGTLLLFYPCSASSFRSFWPRVPQNQRDPFPRLTVASQPGQSPWLPTRSTRPRPSP